MDGKSHVALLALALASTAFAGCIEATGLLNTTDLEVSALDNRRLADEAAAAWGENAQLVAVMAFELSPSDETPIETDPEVGNGLAPAWWYVYALEGKSPPEFRAFKVSANGTVTSEDDAAVMAQGFQEQPDVAPLAGWTVDSDAAVQAAKTDDRFRKAAEGFNATMIEGVAHYEGATNWWIVAMSADGFVAAAVDAATGALKEVQPIDLNMTMPTFEWGAGGPAQWTAEPLLLEGEGVASPGAAPAEFPFATTGPMHGTLTIDHAQELPSDGLQWAILDKDGEAVSKGRMSSWSGRGGSHEVDVGVEKPGEYVLVLSYASWVPFTPGIAPGGVQYHFALELMPGHDEEQEH